MTEHRDLRAKSAAPSAPIDRTLPIPPLDRAAAARIGTWMRGGTPVRMPIRTRLALVRPRMLKAQGRCAS